MESERRRHPVIMHNMWWSVTVVLPSAVQPFLFTHFRRDGWDDELVFRVRNVGVVVIFRSDPRSGHAQQFETTLCVPVATALNLVSKLDAGIDQLMGLILLLPLLIGLTVWVLPVLVRPYKGVLDAGGRHRHRRLLPGGHCRPRLHRLHLQVTDRCLPAP